MEALYQDGVVAITRRVDLTLSAAGALRLETAEGLAVAWPIESVRWTGLEGEQLVLGTTAAPDARLLLDRHYQPWCQSVFPHWSPAWKHPIASTRGLIMTMGVGLGLVVGLALIVLVLVPRFATWIAPLVPTRVEVALANKIEATLPLLLGGTVCHPDPRGMAALLDLEDQLVRAGGLAQAPQIEVIDSAEVNAFALPDNRIVILSGLLEQAPSPEALAGVIAHEFGHIAHHDPVEGLIENSSTGFLFALFTGDLMTGSTTALMGAAVINQRFSREREAAADAAAVATLGRAGIDPAGMVAMFDVFETIEARRGTPPPWLNSHPETRERRNQFAAAVPVPPPAPLAIAAWPRLKHLCLSPHTRTGPTPN